MSSEENRDESEYHTEEDESSSEESGGRPSGHEEEKSANIDENKSDQSKMKKRQCKERIKKECPLITLL